MKNITVFIGSARKKATYTAVREFEENLKKLQEVNFEYVYLSEYNLQPCKGCLVCFNKGEANCPLEDDRDILLEKIEKSDGIIMATPVYSFHVSAFMKLFLDRIAFVFHRPRYFDKTWTAIVTQGISGGKEVSKYLDKVGGFFGFQIVKGCVLTTLDPMTKKQEVELKKKMKKAAGRYHEILRREKNPTPSLLQLMLFRIVRSNMRALNDDFYDHTYYKQNGWLTSDYYYDTSFGIMKGMFGHLFDFMGRQMAKKM